MTTTPMDGTRVPAHVRQEVERVLARAARRLLADEVNLDAVGTAASSDFYPLDGGADDRAALVEVEARPVRHRSKRDPATASLA